MSTPDALWRAPRGITRDERAREQDAAAGSRAARAVPTGPDTSSTASIALRMPKPGRRVYAYLRWSIGGRTIERYVGEASGGSRAEYLADGWLRALAAGLLPTSVAEAAEPSWASSGATRRVMRANPRRDTRPERALRSILHTMGYRYRVDRSPVPDIRARADIVFQRPRVAVFVDGCFWHGCPDHYRPPHTHAEFWRAKLAENQDRDRRVDTQLADHGWRVVHVWEHEKPDTAADRIARTLNEQRAPAP